jgi:hypothetical protein
MTNIEYPWWYIKIISEISSAEDVSQLSVWSAKFQYVHEQPSPLEISSALPLSSKKIKY